MLIKGKPNENVIMRIKEGKKIRTVQLFQFDENGYYELDESKVSMEGLSRILNKYQVVEKEKKKKGRPPKKKKGE